MKTSSICNLFPSYFLSVIFHLLTPFRMVVITLAPYAFCYQDGPYFGPLKCSKEYLNNSLPALVTNAPEQHSAVRAYTLAILRERFASTQPALENSAERFYKNLWTNGEKCTGCSRGFC